ncbi:hypothetical protein [Streptomyces sp. APSN-46.1]|uniref:hypothetical protein n=1 Tax=Streptomyces sp. APSN-46.1 TaxID=2929049 RepID=UPI0035ABE54F
MTGGSLAGFGERSAAVSEPAADQLGLKPGSPLEPTLGDGTPVTLTVAAVYARGLGFGDLTLPHGLVAAHVDDLLASSVLVAAEPGTGREHLADAVREFPGVVVLSAADADAVVVGVAGLLALGATAVRDASPDGYLRWRWRCRRASRSATRGRCAGAAPRPALSPFLPQLPLGYLQGLRPRPRSSNAGRAEGAGPQAPGGLELVCQDPGVREDAKTRAGPEGHGARGGEGESAGRATHAARVAELVHVNPPPQAYVVAGRVRE